MAGSCLKANHLMSFVLIAAQTEADYQVADANENRRNPKPDREEERRMKLGGKEEERRAMFSGKEENGDDS